MASHAILAAEDLVVFGEEGLVDETLVAHRTLEAIGTGVPLPVFVGEPRFAERNGVAARL